MVILGSSLAEETSTDPDSVVTMTNSPESHNRKTLSGKPGLFILVNLDSDV